MKLLDRKGRGVVPGLETLENRMLLSATLVTPIPTQTLTGGQAVPITLATYLNDPAITGGTVVEMQTPLGNIPLQLTNSQTPLTVANFMQYIANGEYTPTIVQRSDPGFVLQGGGTKPDGSNNTPLADVPSEAGISNTTGTIAMALSSGPDTGNNQWFINLADNSSTLDGPADGGPFTVFGNVIDGGMTIANNIAALPTVDGYAENTNWYIPGGGALPVLPSYTGPTTLGAGSIPIPQSALVTDNIVVIPPTEAVGTYTAVSANPALLTASVANGVLTLTPTAGASGTTTVTATLTDIGGETAASTFSVNVQGTPALSVANATVAAGATTPIEFPVTLSSASASPTTFDYSLTPGSAPAGDFQATGSSITIPAGATGASIPVIINGNQSNTGESFTITLSNISSNAIFAGNTATETAVGTITVSSSVSVDAATLTVPYGGYDAITASVYPAVGPGKPTGTVNFIVAGASIGTATISGETATLIAGFTTSGNQVITAIYEGDANYGPSTSLPITVTVGPPPALAPVVAKNTIPSAVVAGVPVHGNLTIKVTNETQGVETGTATIALFASLNGIVDGSSTQITSVRHGVHLAAGKSISITIPVKTFDVALEGQTYTLLFQTTDSSGAVTDATSGPSIQIAAPFVSLAATAAVIKPPVIKLGKSGTFTVELSNAGNIAASGSASINIGLSADDQTETIMLANTTKAVRIKVGGKLTLHLHFVVPANTAAGMYNPYIFISEDDSLANAFGTTPITLQA